MRCVCLLFATLLACKGSPDKVPAPTWHTAPLERVSGTTRGTSYTVELPRGLTLRDRGKSGMRYELPGHDLAITISIGGIERTVAEFVSTHRDDTVWIRKDALPDGFLATYQDPSRNDPTHLMVHLYRGFGEDTNHRGEGMTCHAEFTHPDSITALAVIEKACASLRMLEQNTPPRR